MGAFSLLSLLLFSPPEFIPGGFDSEVVFVDIQKAHYDLVYDLSRKVVEVRSEVDFLASREGYPIIDLVPNPSHAELDGNSVSTEVVRDPTLVTSYRVIREKTKPGLHRATFVHEISEEVVFEKSGVRSAFFMTDLSDRNYLEVYLPSNLEYDTYSMTMTVRLVGAAGTIAPHDVFTNGAQTKSLTSDGMQEWKIEFPPYFNTSSVFFHLLPESERERMDFEYGAKKLPVTIYKKQGGGADLSIFRSTLETTLAELAKDYGDFLHPRLVVYAEEDYGGGMEYHGATVTTLFALPHELTHSYFGRGLMPANGNAGWMDEALASWRDYGYIPFKKVPFAESTMAGHSVYTRMTDDDAYTLGREFMGYLDHSLSKSGVKGGLKTLLKEALIDQKFIPWTTEEFQKRFEDKAGKSFRADFDQYIYGRKPKFEWRSSDAVVNPYHPRLTPEIRRRLL